MTKQHINDPSYSDRFFLKRLPSVVFPYLLVNVLYYFLYWIVGEKKTVTDFLIGFVNGRPLASFSWYVISIIVFYIIFGIIMKLCKRHYLLMCILGLVYFVIHFFVCFYLKFGGWWYISSLLLPIGMIWAVYEEKLFPLVKKHYIFVLIVMTSAFLVSIFLAENKVFPRLGIPIRCVETSSFTAIVLLISMKFCIGNKVLAFFGRISFEIYLVQGIFFILFNSKLISISNGFLYSICVIAATVALAYPLNMIDKWVIKKYRKLIRC